MNTILVDDELWTLKELSEECKNIDKLNVIGEFQNPLEALAFAQKNTVHIAFLDVEMPEMNGLDLAQQLRALAKDMIIIFVSAYDQYVVDAINMDADYFLLKPFTVEKVKRVLDRALILSQRLRKKVYIQTFGSFDIFVNGTPVQFSSAKAKELMAYLVDKKGGLVTSEEGYSVLWEDECYTAETSAKYRKVTMRLRATLEKYGIENILFMLPHGRALNVNEVDCDYYNFLLGDEQAIRSYKGEYIARYSWAEVTNAQLYAACNL